MNDKPRKPLECLKAHLVWVERNLPRLQNGGKLEPGEVPLLEAFLREAHASIEATK